MSSFVDDPVVKLVCFNLLRIRSKFKGFVKLVCFEELRIRSQFKGFVFVSIICDVRI
jgi:hypothetical protein